MYSERAVNMITGINHLTLAVNDLEESFTFYKDILGLKPIQKSRKSAYFLAGDLWIAIVEDACCRSGALPEYTHFSLNVLPENFNTLKTLLQQSGVVEWKENTSEGYSYYFLDPDGHKLEIHSSGLDARIDFGKKHWGDGVEWYV